MTDTTNVELGCISPAQNQAPPKYFVAIDLETTGLDPYRHGICQIGGAVFNAKGELVSGFDRDTCPGPYLVYEGEDVDSRYRDPIFVSAEALSVNGFKLSRIENAEPLSYVLREFLAWLQPYSGQTPIAVFHNAPFDCSFLQYAFRKHSVDPGRLLRRTRDTATMSPDVYGEDNYPRSLEEICKREGIEKVNNHDAFHDALATGKAFFSLKAKLDARRPTALESYAESIAAAMSRINSGVSATWPRLGESFGGPYYGGAMGWH